MSDSHKEPLLRTGINESNGNFDSTENIEMVESKVVKAVPDSDAE